MKARLILTLLCLSLFALPVSACFPDGLIFVVDLNNNKVYRVNPKAGWTLSEFSPGSSQANNPGAIGFTLHGEMLLGNYGNDTIVEIDNLGVFETVLTAADGLNGPWGSSGLVIKPGTGEVFICNSDSSQILCFDQAYTNGTLFADASDGLTTPTAMAFLADGHLLVADSGPSNAILHFNADTGIASAFDTLPEQAADLIIRSTGDVFASTTQGNIYRYVDGDPSNRVLLGNYGGAATTSSMDFSPDHSVIYHVNSTDASIREIDPDTGASTVQLTLPGTPGALAVVGNQYAPGTYYLYGAGLAGTGGLMPALVGGQGPRIGEPTQITAQQFVGGAPIYLILGFVAAPLSFKGGTVLVQLGPTTSIWPLPTSGPAGATGAGQITLPFAIPNDPLLVGTKWYLQALGVDTGAPRGMSFTRGLSMYIGG